MQKYLTLVLLLPAMLAFSQTLEKRNSLALVVSPDFSFKHEVNDLYRSPSQAARPGYRLRVDYFHRLNHRMAIKTGLGYATMNLLQVEEGANFQWPSQNNGNGGYDPSLPGEQTDLRFRQSFHFLQVPLGLRFQLSGGHLKWVAEVESGIMLRLEKKNQQSLQPYAAVATGLEIAGPSGWSFSAQPAYRYHLRSNYPSKIAGVIENRAFLQSLGLEMAARKAF